MIKLTQEDIEYIIANWTTTKSVDLAKKFNVGEKTIQQVARKNNLPQKTSTFLKQQRDSAHQALKEHTEASGIPLDDVKHYWHKSEHFSLFVGNNKEDLDLESILADIFERYFEGATTPLRITPIKSKSFDRLVISDTHIGLDPNKSGNSMYPMKWGKKEIDQTKEDIVSQVLLNKRSDILYIDNLGDYLDGYEAHTTRGGHHLDQNLNTSEQFTIGVEFMLFLFDVFCKEYKYVYLSNITNDNHAGNFGLICGIAIKKIAELKFNNVEVYNQEKFIESYKRGSHLFLLCHGKDKSLMRYGFSAIPTKDNIHKIENYISSSKLNTEGLFVEFSKGDSHIYNADMGSSDLFAYISYPTLAPNSEYITTNFKKGRRGFVFYNIPYDSQNIVIHPFYL